MNRGIQAMHGWRSEPGSYLLLLTLAEPACVYVGRLGPVQFQPGRYVYVGSALGPGGVTARLSRHLRADKRIHWHIDYLTTVAPIAGAAGVYGTERRECAWARAFATLDSAQAPAIGFGSSDCRSGCAAHLWRLPDALSFSWIEDVLTQCPIQLI